MKMALMAGCRWLFKLKSLTLGSSSAKKRFRDVAHMKRPYLRKSVASYRTGLGCSLKNNLMFKSCKEENRELETWHTLK